MRPVGLLGDGGVGEVPLESRKSERARKQSLFQINSFRFDSTNSTQYYCVPGTAEVRNIAKYKINFSCPQDVYSLTVETDKNTIKSTLIANCSTGQETVTTENKGEVTSSAVCRMRSQLAAQFSADSGSP